MATHTHVNDAGNVVSGPWPSLAERHMDSVDALLCEVTGTMSDVIIMGHTPEGAIVLKWIGNNSNAIELLQYMIRTLRRTK